MTKTPEATNITFTNIMGQGRVNQLGGLFINGRPLPKQMRIKIVEMANAGIKPCQISRQLRVSHGCVSKILNRYAETGSVNPGQIGGNPKTARMIIQAYESDILNIKSLNPEFSATDIRNTLMSLHMCSSRMVPTVAAISRLVKNKWVDTRKSRTTPLKHSINEILGLTEPSSPCPSHSSDDSSLNMDKRNRTSFSSNQLFALETMFNTNSYPDNGQREQLSKETGLSEAKIQVWFSNRRARCRKTFGQSISSSPLGITTLSPDTTQLLYPFYTPLLISPEMWKLPSP